MFFAQLEHGVCGGRMSKLQLDWSGRVVGLEVCVSDHRKCRPLSREAMVRAMVSKDLAEGIRMNRRGWELDTEVSIRICCNLGIG